MDKKNSGGLKAIKSKILRDQNQWLLFYTMLG